MKRPTCTVEGCDRPNKARGMCQTHYMQFKRGAPVTPEIKTRSRDFGPVCTVEGCEGAEVAKGLCGMHSVRMKRHGTLDRPVRTKLQKPCGFPGCDQPLYYGGYCHRHIARHKKWETFGLPLEKYAEMGESQKWLCAICDMPETSPATVSREIKELCVDHCHDTNVIRGLLCNNCNRGLGLFRDSPELLRKAAAYLDPHKVGDLV